MTEAEREALLREKLQAIGTDVFPDYEVQWSTVAIRHHGSYSFLEAESEPSIYPGVIFVKRFDEAGNMQDCGCYVKMPDGWRLHYATIDAPEDWKSIEPSLF